MRIVCVGVLIAALSAASHIQAQTSAPPGTITTLVSHDATVLCGGRPITPIHAEIIPPTLTSHQTDRPWTRPPAPADNVLEFSIGSDGQTYDIREVEQPDAIPPVVVSHNPWTAGDQAVLAAWRFDGPARADCRMTITRAARPLSEAGPDLLIQAMGGSRPSRPHVEALRAALARPGDDCLGAPRLRVGVLPDPDVAPLTPGARGYSLARWDVQADGTPSAVEIVGSSGTAAYDAEVARAVGQSTFHAGGPRRGCVNIFRRAAPDRPTAPDPEPSGDPLKDCPAEVRARFTPGRLTYPPAFLDRNIEGWAIVRYDIASWGAIGGIEVLSFQPAEAFADQARGIIASGRATPGFDAAVRCTDRIVFRLPRDEDAPMP